MSDLQDAKLRIVLVGCGGISAAWLSDIGTLSGIEIVGLVDINKSAAEERAKQYELKNALIETDVARALDKLAPDIVFDCTIPAAHVGVTLEALRHGCHVLGEKPMADTLDNARKMVKAAQEAGKVYAVMQNRRFDPNIRRTKALINTQLGPVTTIHCDFFRAPHFGGFREQMEHVLLLDMAIHTFDAARYLSDADPISVYCHEWNPNGSWFAHGASATAIFQMTNDIVYTYRGSWCANGFSTTWESDWRVIGTQATIKWDGTEKVEIEQAQSGGDLPLKINPIPIPTDPQPTSGNGHTGLIRDFIDCIRTGRTPQTICTDNIKSLAMVFGAVESAESGKSTEIRW